MNNMMKRVLIGLTMSLVSLIAVCQDFGRECGLGIRLSGEITFNHGEEDAVFPSFYKQVIGTQLGVYYTLFIDNSPVFIEPQLTGYYCGHKDAQQVFFTPEDFYPNGEDIGLLSHNKLDEWGCDFSLQCGYNFAIGNDYSLDLFSGPEVRCAVSSKSWSRNLLSDHYNRWLMRWKLGTGFNYRHVGVQVYGSYDVTKKSKQVNTRDFTLSLGLGYKF